MALRPKPVEMPKPDERRIDEVIDKGGSVASVEKKSGRKSNFPLRFMRDDMSVRIEASRNKRPMPPSINTWINEAILDKLKAEE